MSLGSMHADVECTHTASCAPTATATTATTKQQEQQKQQKNRKNWNRNRNRSGSGSGCRSATLVGQQHEPIITVVSHCHTCTSDEHRQSSQLCSITVGGGAQRGTKPWAGEIWEHSGGDDVARVRDVGRGVKRQERGWFFDGWLGGRGEPGLTGSRALGT